MKLLIDECLSPALAAHARARGLVAYHVSHRGWGGLKDHEILSHMLAENLVLVTNNRDDFLGLMTREELHPGLMVIIPNVGREEQLRLFDAVLDVALEERSMINRVLEVDEKAVVRSFDLPTL